MALSFNDDQIRSISGEALTVPALIVALNNQKATVVQGKADALKSDTGNGAFFDFFRNTIAQYHAEKKYKDGIVKTDYTFAMLDNGAAQRPGNIHFPTDPVWAGLPPKVSDANSGLPTSNLTPYEIASLPPVTARILTLRTGFADGAISSTLVGGYTPGTDVEVNSTAFAVDQFVIIDKLNVSLLAKIVAVKPPSTTGDKDLELEIIVPPAGAIGSGARIRNFHPGFTNDEREGTLTPYAPEYLAYLSGLLDSAVGVWLSTVTPQLAALAALDPGGVENAQRDIENGYVTAAKEAIEAWQAAPATGAGVGRYGDSALSPLEQKVTDRTSQAPARVTAINGYLGSVTQDPDGTFTGAGHYLSLFKWVDIRASKAGGTLFTFYNFDMIFKFIDQKIVTANARKSEYDNKILVTKLTEDSQGSVVKVQDSTGLGITDQVRILDDSMTPIVTASIISITGLEVALDADVSGFLLDKSARLVKFL